MDCRKVKDTESVSFDNWGFISNMGDIGNYVGDTVASAITVQLRETPPDAYMPVLWSGSDGLGGRGVDDPGTIYFGIPLTPHDFEYIHYSITLTELIDDVIEFDDYHDDERATSLIKLAAHLREQADRLDAALRPE